MAVLALAQVNRRSDWWRVDFVAGSSRDGDPYFIGVGVGFDIVRFLVYANGPDEAWEIAEEKWPARFISNWRDRREDDWEAEAAEIRVLVQAHEVARFARRVLPGTGEYDIGGRARSEVVEAR